MRAGRADTVIPSLFILGCDADRCPGVNRRRAFVWYSRAGVRGDDLQSRQWALARSRASLCNPTWPRRCSGGQGFCRLPEAQDRRRRARRSCGTPRSEPAASAVAPLRLAFENSRLGRASDGDSRRRGRSAGAGINLVKVKLSPTAWCGFCGTCRVDLCRHVRSVYPSSFQLLVRSTCSADHRGRMGSPPGSRSRHGVGWRAGMLA